MKKILAILLAISMLLSLAVPVFADGETVTAWEWTSEGKLPKALAENAGGWLFDHQATNANTGIYDALKTEGSKLVLEFDISVEDMGWWAQVKMDNKGSVSLVVDKGDNNAAMWLGFDNTATGSKITIDGYALVTAYEEAGGDGTSFQFTLNRAGTCKAGNLTAVYVTTPVTEDGGEGDTPVMPDCETALGTIENASTELEVLSLPSVVNTNGTIVVHFTGTTTGAFRYWISKDTWTQCSAAVTVSDTEFDVVAEIVATADGANQVQFKGPSYGVALDGLNITYCGVFYGTLEEYEAALLPSYTVTVTGGSADVTEAKEGDTVTVTANAAPYGKQFTGWTAEGVTLEDDTLAEVTFTMPANNVTLTANYEDVPVEPDEPTTKEMWALDPEAPITYTAWTTLTAGSEELGKLLYTDGAVFVLELSEYNGLEIAFQNTVDWSYKGIGHWWEGEGNAEHIVDGDTIYVVFDCADFVEAFSADATFVEYIKEGRFQIVFNAQNTNTLVNAYITAPAYNVYISNELVGTYAVGETVEITAPSAPEGMAFAGWIVREGDIELKNENAFITTFKMPDSSKMPELRVRVEPTYEESASNIRPGFMTSGGYVIMGDEYHALIGNGIIITTPHVFDANNVCIYCGHYVEPVADESEVVVEVTDPVEPSTEEEEDVTVDVEEPAEDTNPGTGLALAVVPMLIAAAAVVISKR